MWLLPNGVDYELIHTTCTMFLKELNPFGRKGIETVHNGKRSLGPQTSIDSKQTKKTVQLSIYYGKGRMTLGRGKRPGNSSHRSGLVYSEGLATGAQLGFKSACLLFPPWLF